MTTQNTFSGSFSMVPNSQVSFRQVQNLLESPNAAARREGRAALTMDSYQLRGLSLGNMKPNNLVDQVTRHAARLNHDRRGVIQILGSILLGCCQPLQVEQAVVLFALDFSCQTGDVKSTACDNLET